MAERNHEIEKIYMQQLKNVEIVLYVLKKKKNHALDDINYLRQNIVKDERYIYQKKSTIEKSSLGSFFILALVALFSFFLGRFFYNEKLLWVSTTPLAIIFYLLSGFFMLFAIISLISFFSTPIKNEKERKVRLKKAESVYNQSKEQMEKNLALANKKEVNIQKINSEIKKYEVLRNNMYSVNWLPSRYRSIHVVLYISDMINSSDINLNEALKYYLLQEANNKLDQVLQKLDQIIENQNQIILNQAILQAQNKTLTEKTQTMIEHLSSIESNVQLSAEYARIGTQYAQANAYFSLANYLKK